MPKELNFTIGADPEFNIVMYDEKISAKKIINSLFKKNAENAEDFSSNMGYKTKAGVVGWDGCDSTAELRPNPSNTVQGLTENIGNLIKSIAEKSESFDLSTLSNKGSVGGHIHFSINNNLNTSSKLQILHKQMSSFYLPVMMGENKLNLKIRNKSGTGEYKYGDIRDFRVDTGSGSRDLTYEFRVPSAEWITSKKICQATIAYLATVYNEIINNQNNIKKFKEILYKTEKQGEALQNLALSDYTFLTSVLLNKIKKAIKTFELYPEYKDEIEYILNPNKVLKDKEKVEFNLLYGWDFNKSKAATKEDLLNQKIVNKKATEIDMDTLSKMIWIGYNNDTNVESFVKEIKKRIITMKWKLNNEYFFFGLKKGIKNYIIMNKDGELIKGNELIETTEDQRTIVTVFAKMKNKMMDLRANKQTNNKKVILVGIPYEERINEKYKNFIETVYNLEKDCEPKTINRKDIIEDFNKKEEDKGKIWKLYNKEDSNIAGMQQERYRTEQQENIINVTMAEESENENIFLDEATEEINENAEIFRTEFPDNENEDEEAENEDEEDHCNGCDGDCDECEWNHDNN